MTAHIPLSFISTNTPLCKQNPLSPSKQNYSSSPSKYTPEQMIKKLKIELSDKVFELKKMEEDFAEEKAHLCMQFNQERNMLNGVVKELKEKMHEENQLWIIKVQQIRNQLQAKFTQSLTELTQSHEIHLSQSISSTLESHISTIATLQSQTQSLSSTLSSLSQSHKVELNYLINSHQKQIQQIKQNYKQEMEKIKQNLEKEKNEEVGRERQKAREEGKRREEIEGKIRNMIEQKGWERIGTEKKIKQLEREVNETGEKIKELEGKLDSQRERFIKQIQRVQRQKQKIQKRSQQKLKQSQEEWKQNMQSLNQHYRAELKKLQLTVQKILTSNLQKQKLWQQKGQKVLKLYQTRQARQQDVKLIEHLQIQLIKKQFQLEREKQELKTCKLQLDNMDDLYKRIFCHCQGQAQGQGAQCTCTCGGNGVNLNGGNGKKRRSLSFQLKKMRLPGIVVQNQSQGQGGQESYGYGKTRNTYGVKGQYSFC